MIVAPQTRKSKHGHSLTDDNVYLTTVRFFCDSALGGLWRVSLRFRPARRAVVRRLELN